MNKKEERMEKLLQFIRWRNGRRFTIAIMAKEFNVSESTIQSDLSYFEIYGLIERLPSYDSLHRQNGNIIVHTDSRKRQSHKTDYG